MSSYLHPLVIALLCTVMLPAFAETLTVQRNGWDWDRADIIWYSGNAPEQRQGAIKDMNGWAEYDFTVPVTGWYELFLKGGVPHWERHLFLDGKLLYFGHSVEEDAEAPGTFNQSVKEINLPLTAGKHTLRIQRLNFPGCLPTGWELRAAEGRPAGSIVAVMDEHNIRRVGERLTITITGGTTEPTEYELVAKHLTTGELTPVGAVAFPAGKGFFTKTVSIPCPSPGIFHLLARVDGTLLRPADLHAGQYTIIDTRPQARSTEPLQKTLVVEIDYCEERTEGFWEKDGKSTVVNMPFGKYRESSGNGSSEHWATDGFSYSFDLPDARGPYLLEVDYPDDDRRTMGFWVNDQVPVHLDMGAVMTGGVDTGDHYRLSHQMKTHQAFFYPRNAKNCLIAVVNLNHGMKAAASRMRIYKIDGPLPDGPPNRPGGRRMGYYFEEPSRWLRQFGASSQDIGQHILTLERWAEMCRYTGANLWFPTVNVYQGNAYPSQVLEGYFISHFDQTRLTALIAEKHDIAYIPELHISGNAWFDTRIMRRGSPEADAWMLRDKEGNTGPYNALHPFVQDKYLAIVGELADRLAGYPAFHGISSRLMAAWQWQGWNALPGLNWGYDDWTVAEFSRETGIVVPGNADEPQRFRQRFDYLTGPARERWVSWRCGKILNYHRRLRDRIRQASPHAALYITYFTEPMRDAMLASTEREKIIEMGIDPDSYAQERGIVILPSTPYGRRYSTPIMDAAITEGMGNPLFTSLGMLGDRGFGVYASYFEPFASFDWKPFGATTPGISFDSCLPTGRHELELYATLLADCDYSTITNGGNGYVYGSQQYLGEFLAEYKALPALPFTPLPGGRDPVAIWYRQCDDGFYWYAVNREPFPVKTALTFVNVKKLFAAATGQQVKLTGNTLTLDLQPYQLRAFKALGTPRITRCVTRVPDEEIQHLHEQMAFAVGLAKRLQRREVAPDMSQAQVDACLQLITEAQQALAEGRTWRARTNLERQDLVRLYDLVGAYPPGLHHRRVARGLPKTARDAPALEFAGEQEMIGDARGKLSTVKDLAVAPDGSLWVASPEQTICLAPDGTYNKTLALLQPMIPDNGDPWSPPLRAPYPQLVEGLRVLPDGRLASLAHNGLLLFHEPDTGRVLPLATGNDVPLPGNTSWHLATDVKGHLYVACSAPPSAVGVWKFQPDGTGAFSFGGDVPTNRLCTYAVSGIAVDAAGRIYVSDQSRKRIVVYDAAGTQLAETPCPAGHSPGRLAVTADGGLLFVTTRNGEIAAYRHAEHHALSLLWVQPVGAAVTALAVNHRHELVLGLETPLNEALVLICRVGHNGLTIAHTAVPPLAADYPRYLRERTQLKTYDGKVYYLCENKLVRVTPGTPDIVEVACDPGVREVRSFAFDQAGNLFLGSVSGPTGRRGEYVYRCQKTAAGWASPVSVSGESPLHADAHAIIPYDVAVDHCDRIIVRWMEDGNWPHLRVYTREPDGTMHKFADAGEGASARGPWFGFYGLHVDAMGNSYVAGGPARSITSLTPDGAIRWQHRGQRHQGPGILPLRGPQAVTTDRQGRAWVADTDASRILCFDSQGHYLAAFGAFAALDARDGHHFSFPTGIAAVTDARGHEWLYIADPGNHRLLKYRINAAAAQ
jgi:sugar lactone lactonase YvrE